MSPEETIDGLDLFVNFFLITSGAVVGAGTAFFVVLVAFLVLTRFLDLLDPHK